MPVHVGRCTHRGSCLLTLEVDVRISSLKDNLSYDFGPSFLWNLKLAVWAWVAGSSRLPSSILQHEVTDKLTARSQFFLGSWALNIGFMLV